MQVQVHGIADMKEMAKWIRPSRSCAQAPPAFHFCQCAPALYARDTIVGRRCGNASSLHLSLSAEGGLTGLQLCGEDDREGPRQSPATGSDGLLIVKAEPISKESINGRQGRESKVQK